MSSGSGAGRNQREVVCKEARETVNQQLKRIRSTDDKCMRIFRFNILIIGVLVSGLAIAVRNNGVESGHFLNIWTALGAFFIFLSMATSAFGYSSSEYELGITEVMIEEVQDGEYQTAQDLEGDLQDLYKGWLQHNRNVDNFNTYLITLAILGLFNGISMIAGGTIVGIYGARFEPVSIGALVLLLVALFLVNMVIYRAESLYVKLAKI